MPEPSEPAEITGGGSVPHLFIPESAWDETADPARGGDASSRLWATVEINRVRVFVEAREVRDDPTLGQTFVNMPEDREPLAEVLGFDGQDLSTVNIRGRRYVLFASSSTR